MNNRYLESIDEGLRSTESADVALVDIKAITAEVNEALLAKSKGVVGASVEDDDGVHAIIVESDHDNVILCRLSPSDTDGYPVIVRSSRLTSTMVCLDKESLERQVAELLKDAGFARDLRSLMSPPQ